MSIAITSFKTHVIKLINTLILLLFSAAVSAQTGGLTKGKTALQFLLDNLLIILPLAAVIIGIIIAVLYSAEIMRKDDAVRWVTGVLLAGSVAEIVVMIWK